MNEVNVTITIKSATKGKRIKDKFAMVAGAGLVEQLQSIDLKKGRFTATRGLRHSLFYGVFADGGTRFQITINGETVVDKPIATTEKHAGGHKYFIP